MQRPLGVTVLAVLNLIGAFFSVVVGLLLIFGMSLIGNATAKAEGAMMLLGLGVVGGIFMFIFAAISCVMGYGLWNLRNWARVVTLILIGISLLISIPGLLMTLFHPSSILVVQLISVGINVLVIWYLLQPKVKTAFAAAW